MLQSQNKKAYFKVRSGTNGTNGFKFVSLEAKMIRIQINCKKVALSDGGYLRIKTVCDKMHHINSFVLCWRQKFVSFSQNSFATKSDKMQRESKVIIFVYSRVVFI